MSERIGLADRIERAWTNRPLSAQLVVLITGLLAVGLTMSGTVMIGLLQRHLISQVDAQLTSDAALRLFNQTGAAASNGMASTVPTAYYLRLHHPSIDPDQVTFYPETTAASGTPILPELLGPGEARAGTGEYTQAVTVASSKEGHPWRVVATTIEVKGATPSTGVLTIALPLTDVQHTLRTTAAYFSIAAVVIVFAGGWVGHWLVRRSLSPLRSIESTAGDLTQRVRPGPPSTEVGSLALSLNSMLTQVEQSFEARQASEKKIRRFVSDASHELRTPLAAISGYCELYSMGGVPAERVEEVMGRISSESTRMAVLVEDLLTLARLDEGRPLEFTDIDLVKMADNAVFDLQALDSTRTVGLSSLEGRRAPMSLVVSADRDRIAQVFTNLIGNIVRYTPAGSPVEIALGTAADYAVVEFRDHGPGIADRDRSRVFERFYRSDSSRNRRSGGSGLGLAIVSGILGAHHGNAALTKTKGGGLTVRIELPLPRPQNEAMVTGDADSAATV